MHAIGSRCTLASLLVCGIALLCLAEETETSSPATDPDSGLYIDEDENWKLVRNNCASCHSGRLLTQHRLDRTGWLKSIQRMQAEEELWDLGDTQPKILDYLVDFYGNEGSSSTQRVRRAQLVRQNPEGELASDAQPVVRDPDTSEPQDSTESSEDNDAP